MPDLPPDEATQAPDRGQDNSAENTARHRELVKGYSIHVENEVVLNIEFVSDDFARTGKVVIILCKTISIAIFSMLVVRRFDDGVSGLVDHDFLATLNVVVSSVSLAALLFTSCLFSWRTYRAIRSRRLWTPLRRMQVIFVTIDLAVHTLNTAIFLMPNAVWLSQPCHPFGLEVRWSAFFQFSAWLLHFSLAIVAGHALMPIHPSAKRVKGLYLYNLWLKHKGLKRPPDIRTVLDLPLWVHLDKVIFVWLPGQIFLLFQLLWSLGALGTPQLCQIMGVGSTSCSSAHPPPGQSCADWMSNTLGGECIPFHLTTLVTLSSIGFGWVLLTLGIGMVALLAAYVELGRYRYQMFRAVNIAVRIRASRWATTFVVFVLCISMFWFVDVRSCTSFLLTFYGMTPLHVLLTTHIITQAIALMPMPPKEQQLALHIWLQSFSWTEEAVPRKLAARPAIYAHEPMFCFETASKALYFSLLVYYYDGTDKLREAVPVKGDVDPNLSIDSALSMWSLDRHEVVTEHTQDLTCMLAWSAPNRTLVLAFRGTASLANVWQDLRVWRRPHPLGVGGSAWTASRSLVHAGFHDCWLQKGFGTRVVDRVRELVTSGHDGHDGKHLDATAGKPWHVMCMGHSLGGALACLAACDVATMARKLEPTPDSAPHLTVSCYTYGCPRIGNHAFAKYYAMVVPDSWDLLHTNDAVARNGKFFRMYKRAGKRVIVSPDGDLIIRPSLAESSVLRGHSSIQAHLLSTYGRSMAAVIKAQAGDKGEESSRAAIAEVGAILHQQASGTAARADDAMLAHRLNLITLWPLSMAASTLMTISGQPDEHVATGQALDSEGEVEAPLPLPGTQDLAPEGAEKLGTPASHDERNSYFQGILDMGKEIVSDMFK